MELEIMVDKTFSKAFEFFLWASLSSIFLVVNFYYLCFKYSIII